MRIVKETPDLMILKDKNSIIFVIVGIALILLGFVIIFKPGFFINQPQPPPLWLGFVIILFGGLFVAVAKITTIKLDKSINKLSFSRKGLIGQNNQEYELNQIKEVEFLGTSGGGGGYSYHLAFVFNDGKIVPLNPVSSSTTIAWRRQIVPERTLGARIATFLGVPFQEIRPPTVAELLSAVKEIEKQKKI